MPPTRVDEIALHVRRLAQATGVKLSPDSSPTDAATDGLDGITSDLDIEALSKGLLDAARDLDLYLQRLREKRPAPVAELRAEIERLQKELAQKDDLLASSVAMLENAERAFEKLKNTQVAAVYNM